MVGKLNNQILNDIRQENKLAVTFGSRTCERKQLVFTKSHLKSNKCSVYLGYQRIDEYWVDIKYLKLIYRWE